jgi:ABC-type lipoprotein release transport system permease subunit
LVKGSYLDNSKQNQVLVGVSLLSQYGSAAGTGSIALKNADVGSTVRTTTNGISKEVLCRCYQREVTNIDSRIFMLDRELRPMIGRTDFNVNEIAIRSNDTSLDLQIKNILLGNNVEALAKVQTWQEAQPQFIKDISATFALLGDLIGGIGLAVASITIFIVIFVNAITRRKFIGILKGIGISPAAIEISYMFQSFFYAVSGSGAGLCIVYGLLVPFFSTRPINFPFSDGVFIADVPGVFARIFILLIATIIAGYLPARMIVKQKTLDAILGR